MATATATGYPRETVLKALQSKLEQGKQMNAARAEKNMADFERKLASVKAEHANYKAQLERLLEAWPDDPEQLGNRLSSIGESFYRGSSTKVPTLVTVPEVNLEAIAALERVISLIEALPPEVTSLTPTNLRDFGVFDFIGLRPVNARVPWFTGRY